MARTKDPIAKLELRQSVAVRQFAEAADELDEVAKALTGHASAADHQANEAARVAAYARTQADQAARQAARIRELIG